ncbi:hypothetical protein CR513_11678, partial [Mucuna pruriens]
MARNIIDVANSGALMDKTPAATRHLILNKASNTQRSHHISSANTIDNLRLENQLTELTSLVRQLVVGQHQQSAQLRVCGICTSVEHPTDMCPTLQETELDSVKCIRGIRGYQYGRQPYPSQPYDTIPTESESRAIYIPTIRIPPKHSGSESEQLSTVGSKISSTIIPPTTITSSTTRQFTFNGRVDEADE